MKTALFIIGVIALGFLLLLVLACLLLALTCCKVAREDYDDFEEIERDSENEK